MVFASKGESETVTRVTDLSLCNSVIHMANSRGALMSLLQDLTTATQRSGTRPSSVSRARVHQDTREAFLDDVAERMRPKLHGIRQALSLWIRRHKDRAILRSMSPRDIHDFCLSQTDAETEMNKPFWRA